MLLTVHAKNDFFLHKSLFAPYEYIWILWCWEIQDDPPLAHDIWYQTPWCAINAMVLGDVDKLKMAVQFYVFEYSVVSDYKLQYLYEVGVGGGVYWIHLFRPSVRPTVCPSVRPSVCL